MRELFRKFAESTSRAAGSPWAFCTALALVLIWAVSGPIFGYSDTWQLVINTSTTIVTFLMVFLIQNAQNRDSLTLQLKLDELLCTIKGTREGMVNLEDLSEESLDRLRDEFRKTARAGNVSDGKGSDGNSPDDSDAP